MTIEIKKGQREPRGTRADVLLVSRYVGTPSVEVHIVNSADRSVLQSAEGVGPQCHLLPYRRFIRLLSVGGAILPLLSSQGRSATLRWASPSNRIYYKDAGLGTLGDVSRVGSETS